MPLVNGAVPAKTINVTGTSKIDVTALASASPDWMPAGVTLYSSPQLNLLAPDSGLKVDGPVGGTNRVLRGVRFEATQMAGGIVTFGGSGLLYPGWISDYTGPGGPSTTIKIVGADATGVPAGAVVFDHTTGDPNLLSQTSFEINTGRMWLVGNAAGTNDPIPSAASVTFTDPAGKLRITSAGTTGATISNNLVFSTSGTLEHSGSNNDIASGNLRMADATMLTLAGNDQPRWDGEHGQPDPHRPDHRA